MAVKIQVKRGAETSLPTLSQAELGFTTDTNKVFVGDGSSNHEIITSSSTTLDSRYFTETELGDSSSNANSGAKKIGVYDEFTKSTSTNVQDVLKDFDTDLNSIDDEWVQDVIGAMVSGNTESGITVEYDDPNGKLNFSVTGGGTSVTWYIKTGAYTLSTDDGIFADTSGGSFSLTLPPTPSLGDTVYFYDYKDTWTSHNLTIARNGSNIEGSAEDLICDTHQYIILTYSDATVGWKISSELLSYNGKVISEDTTDVSSANFVLDEDDMSSDSNTKLATQQSIKAYAMGVNDYLMTAGRINNPLLHLPLKNGFNMPYGTGSVTFTRSTTATYVDRYGVVKTAAIDEARFEKEGLLIEGPSTNLLTYSEQFDNGVWTKANTTLSVNSTAAPDGNTTAEKLIENSDTDQAHHISKAITLTAGTDYTLTIFAKKAERSHILIMMHNPTDLRFAQAIVDLDTGTVTYGAGKVQELDNGWYRIQVTGSPTVSSGNNAYFRICEGGASGDDYYDGNGTSGLYLWGAQLEELPFASSYIPTTTAAVTRTKEVCYIDFENNCPASGEKITVLSDANVIGGKNAFNQYIFYAYSDSSFIHAFSNNIHTYLGYNGCTVLLTNRDLSSTKKRIGLTFDESTVKGFQDGVYINSGSSGLTTTSKPTKFYLGSKYSEVLHLFGHISNFRIYDVALTEAEMKIA